MYLLNVNSNSDVTYQGANLKLSWLLPSIESQLSGIVAYDSQDLAAHTDADFSPVDLFQGFASDERESVTAEMRMDSSWTDSVSTLFGAFVSAEDREIHGITRVVPFGLDVPDASTQTADTFALFGTMFWTLPQDFEVTVGLRYDDNEQVLEAATDVANPRRTIDTSHVTPRLSLTKFWTPDNMTYFSVANGVREGGFNSTVVPQELWVIDPDEVWTAEVGQKATFGDTRLSGAVFYNDYSDFIGQNTFVLRSDGNGFTGAVINQGDATSYGAEVQLFTRINDNWTVSGDVAYTHTRADNQDGWVEATGGELATDRLIFQPDWTFNLRSEYGFVVGNGWLAFRGGVYGKGDSPPATQKLAPAQVEMIPEYFLVNAGISYAISRFQFQVFASNLTDEGYWASYIDESLLGTPRAIQGAERKFGLQVSYNF